MNIRYFAWVREKVGIEEETIELPSNVKTVSDLIAHLKDLDDYHASAFEEEDAIRVALDQEHVEPDTELGAAREVAFFPPMTGG
ncbi:MAG: molybdopterin converting factor subunit 1 [Roseibium album]|uniref:Molybdopterin synthase sulfur carrier subunit n=1 Tax=Roseibium album TaxID=311410 RepID=A0A0M6ZEY6_9HYPH|nr:molybdopterin converting factor subunit 1 [Roseibium album]MBG6146519.1 molybdopterin synthase sulfur carrier subunit [Labrenzia sp. EL_142]MBG6156484.1 molybdopterin synthase sulfur carrier subunit [Labrenzia sp. EL_162]MBG6164817.1 molybdopterin synthase sulfur carrier subunit [Labrenzia sp. EL_195]MBG6173494.1 molybdopterin synthase sulfur carrier subunit [Labrenzia sp. EL_132]MBG6195576.1 molybdopterin synthase sulfur carrier subunit [Labrenzia sp. EL_159]MBG6202241.1 molybdopterin syn